MTGELYWEERGDIIEGPASAERAAACFALATANEHSRLVGTLEAGFSYYAFYLEGVGYAIRVYFRRMIDPAVRPESRHPVWEPTAYV